jgi:hypothetical protein
VKVALDVNVEAWEQQYRTEGEWDTGADVEAYVRELVAGSRPAELGLWRAIEHPSGWSARRRWTG